MGVRVMVPILMVWFGEMVRQWFDNGSGWFDNELGLGSEKIKKVATDHPDQ